MSVQMKPGFIRKKECKISVNFTVMNWLQKQLQKLILIAESCGCKAVALDGRGLNGFVAKAADDFETSVSSASRLANRPGLAGTVPELNPPSRISDGSYLGRKSPGNLEGRPRPIYPFHASTKCITYLK
jgi:hypothetical protein